MTTYSLNIQIDDPGLDKIANSQKRVTLIKSVGGKKGSNVAWVSFDPAETSVVTWTEDYFIYGTRTISDDGAAIQITSRTHDPVETGAMYTFANGHFTTGTGGKDGVFNVDNEQPDAGSTPFNFGLAQKATINGTVVLAPLNMVPANMGDKITFDPEETISIYLSDLQDNGVVISTVDSDALTVTLSTQSPNGVVHLNSANDTFHLGPLAAAA
jgi:hypothetical protein